MDDAADHPTIIDPMRTPAPQEQRFDPLPLRIAQPANLLCHPSLPDQGKSESHRPAGSRETVVTQRSEEGHRAPVAVSREATQAISFRRPSRSGAMVHGGLDPGLVDEDGSARIEACHDR
jgi:hypothetical protein